MFAQHASRLAGHATALIGWSPDAFWAATPVELASILAALTPPAPDLPDLDALMEQFPDG